MNELEQALEGMTKQQTKAFQLEGFYLLTINGHIVLIEIEEDE